MEQISKPVDITQPSKLKPKYKLYMLQKPHCKKSIKKVDVFGGIFWTCRHEYPAAPETVEVMGHC